MTLKQLAREVFSLAQFLDPLVSKRIPVHDASSTLISIGEPLLVEMLCHNKVAAKFGRRLDYDSLSREKFFDSFEHLKSFYRDFDFRNERDQREFDRIKGIFDDNDIEFMLIKSDGSFPSESDNLDVLIKPEKLQTVAKLLEKAGYSELIQIREPHKFLFRNLNAFEVLPLHIHTIVEWEGTPFVDLRELWRRCVLSNSSNGFLIPSPEDCILITAAHLFFENQEIKLADLLKIDSEIRNNDIDWGYMFDHLQKLGWDDAFRLTMILLDRVCQDLYGRNMVHPEVLLRLREANDVFVNSLSKVLKPFRNSCKVLEIPYLVSALFLIRRVLRASGLSTAAKIEHLTWIVSDVIRRRTRPY